VHANELKMGRITNFRNWGKSLYGDNNNTILALEYWCHENDQLWKQTEQQWVNLAIDEIKTTGLIKNANVTDGFVYKIPKSYPTYHKGYKDDLIPVENFLKTVKHVHFIGRYGAFKYNNQDHSILMGWMLAQNLTNNAKYDLWEVNTNYENYQENALITKTGLVMQK
jgi:protoporphyrinogen oxidase